ncbi:M23 family metallopeptidase [Shinella daejeonensis]|uniref:M23 family metallopeptidase n=1 Tax=Shinella daejeonensis TaxID=659017 RepID=UPI0020C79CB7|nr:M23 family metallopeptidase [Shinella daejeonensis]
MSERSENRVFGKRKQQHVVILASGDRIRHMTIRPWMTAVAFCCTGMFAVGYLAATSYLVLRDDLIGATMARQARMQHDYEDRISALRAQVDRVTSRQLLDQQVVEEKVEKLMRQQLALSARHGKLDALLNRAENAGLPTTASVPDPERKPVIGERQADAGGALRAIEVITATTSPSARKTAKLAYAAEPQTVADRADRLFSRVTLSLKDIESEQIVRIQSLAADASETADAIRTILRRTGVEVTEPDQKDPDADIEAMGGPFVEPVAQETFEESINDLDMALARLDTARRTARQLPFGNPSPGSDISSRFGNRTDPFLKRLALHAGIDFRVRSGTKVRSAGAGTVTVAGRTGGYGNMVEIDHGNGLTSRYAHLKRVLVKIGDSIDTSDIVGLSGTTGRSTGPHLHYEVRRNGKAIDPMRFLTAGMKLTTYME